MAERFFCPTVRAPDWKAAEPKINDTLQRLVRMLNQISTGAGIPAARLEDPLDQPSIIDPDGNTTVDSGKLVGESDKKNLIVKVNATNPTYQIDVDADHLKLDDFTLLLEDIDLTIDITASGVNGLDTGSEASDTWYSIWVIHNPTTATTAGLFSTSTLTPIMPSGYTKKRRVGWVRNNDPSDFLKFYQIGGWWDWDIHYNVLSTALAATTWTDVNCANYAPPTSELLRLAVFSSDADGHHTNTWIRRNGISEDGSDDCFIGGSVGGADWLNVNMVGLLGFCDTDQIIEYKNGDSDLGLKINIQSYYDPI